MHMYPPPPYYYLVHVRPSEINVMRKHFNEAELAPSM